MGYSDQSREAQPQGWLIVAALHKVIADVVERDLRSNTGLSVVEYTLLDVLRRQRGRHHLRMAQVAHATALSTSATTRLVSRLEGRGLLRRYLCEDDRRGIYTELTEAGLDLVTSADEPHRAAVARAIGAVGQRPELAGVLAALAPVLGATDHART